MNATTATTSTKLRVEGLTREVSPSAAETHIARKRGCDAAPSPPRRAGRDCRPAWRHVEREGRGSRVMPARRLLSCRVLERTLRLRVSCFQVPGVGAGLSQFSGSRRPGNVAQLGNPSARGNVSRACSPSNVRVRPVGPGRGRVQGRLLPANHQASRPVAHPTENSRHAPFTGRHRAHHADATPTAAPARRPASSATR